MFKAANLIYNWQFKICQVHPLLFAEIRKTASLAFGEILKIDKTCFVERNLSLIDLSQSDFYELFQGCQLEISRRESTGSHATSETTPRRLPAASSRWSWTFQSAHSEDLRWRT